MDRDDAEFERAIAVLAALEKVAFRAAETARKRRGRPGGTAVLPHDFIIALESTFRDITNRTGGLVLDHLLDLLKNF